MFISIGYFKSIVKEQSFSIQTYQAIQIDHNQILLMPPKKVKDSQPKVVVPEGDPKIGKSVYTQNCSGCHGIDGDGKGAGAPPLGGIIGRLAGSTLFANGKALKNSKIIWSPEHLWLFLDNPGRYVPGIKMGFPGLGNSMEKAHLIAFLKTV